MVDWTAWRVCKSVSRMSPRLRRNCEVSRGTLRMSVVLLTCCVFERIDELACVVALLARAFRKFHHCRVCCEVANAIWHVYNCHMTRPGFKAPAERSASSSIQEAARVLGLRRVPANELELAEMTRKGLPSATLSTLSGSLGWTRAALIE